MKIWTDSIIKDRDGNPLMEQEPDKAWTLGSIIERACNNEHPSEKGLSFKGKLERFLIATRCYKPKEQPVEIDSEEATMIKDLVAKMFSPLVCGQVHTLIENPPQQTKEPPAQEEARPNGHG